LKLLERLKKIRGLYEKAAERELSAAQAAAGKAARRLAEQEQFELSARGNVLISVLVGDPESAYYSDLAYATARAAGPLLAKDAIRKEDLCRLSAARFLEARRDHAAVEAWMQTENQRRRARFESGEQRALDEVYRNRSKAFPGEDHS
jgi:hypothetical protein